MDNQLSYPFLLTTDRVRIQSPEEADGAALRDAIADSIQELRPWMPWAQTIPTVDEATINCKKAQQEFEDGIDYRLHLFDRASGVFLGASGLHRIDWMVPKAEIGYWIRTPYSGMGYITETVREITRFAIEDLRMRRVEIRVSSTNVRSKAVPERLGFTCEGTLRNDERHVDGSLRDTIVFSYAP